MSSIGLFIISLVLVSTAVAKECNDEGRIYKVCSDQGTAYQATITSAVEQNKLVLIKFGADWCPWCKSLHRLFTEEKFWGRLEEKLILSEVGVYRYDSQEKIESGRNILFALLAANGQDTSLIQGFPFIAVVDPKTSQAVFLNTGGLEHNTENQKGHDPEKVYTAITEAIKKLSVN